MKIKKIKYSSYKIPLYKKLSNSNHTYSFSNGFIIELLISETNSTKIISAYGDVSPLDKFSNESIQEINWGIESFIAGIDYNVDYKFSELLQLVEIHCTSVPSLHFALDTALYDASGQIQNLPICKIINSNSADVISLSDVYMGQSEIELANSNIIKYKLGVKNIQDDVKIINSIVEKNSEVCFRFDANQAYTENDFYKVVDRLQHINIDYFEEPIKNPSYDSLSEILNQCDVNIAIDESLYNGSNYMNWLEKGLINSVIIKPSIFGGYKKFLNFCLVCNNHNINIILSSALETGIGNLATIHLAASLNNNLFHGLNIHHFFNEFPYVPMYSKNQSTIDLKNIRGLGI